MSTSLEHSASAYLDKEHKVYIRNRSIHKEQLLITSRQSQHTRFAQLYTDVSWCGGGKVWYRSAKETDHSSTISHRTRVVEVALIQAGGIYLTAVW